LLRVRHIFFLFCTFFLFCGFAEAAGEYAFIARGTVIEIVSQGQVSDYKMKLADGNIVLLKSPGMELEEGQDVAFFVRPGAKEGGLDTYLPINFPLSSRPCPFFDGISRIRVTDANVMMFNKQGQSVGKLYDNIEPFHEGLASVRVKEYDFMWGFVDTEGTLVIEPNFDGYTPRYYFQNGFAAVSTSKDGKGYIDKKGNLAIFSKDEDWRPLTPFSEGLAFITYFSESKNGDIHLIDEKGIIQNQKPLANDRMRSDACQPFSNGLAALRKGDVWGFIDHTGAFVIEPEYSYVKPFSEGYAAVQTLDKKWGYIDTKGNWIVNASYEQAYPFSDGLAPVQLGNHWGYVDTNGELIIKAVFENVGYFSDGVAPARFKAENSIWLKWGLIEKNGNWVIKPRYDIAYLLEDALDIPRFSDDLLLVMESVKTTKDPYGGLADKYAWIDRSGKETLVLFLKSGLW